MIARVWTGRTKSRDAETYRDYVTRTGVTALNGTPGNLGTWLLRRVDGKTAEFTVISLWESMETVKNFAGPAPEKAVYYPEDERYLLALDPHVRHYEILSRPEQGVPARPAHEVPARPRRARSSRPGAEPARG